MNDPVSMSVIGIPAPYVPFVSKCNTQNAELLLEALPVMPVRGSHTVLPMTLTTSGARPFFQGIFCGSLNKTERTQAIPLPIEAEVQAFLSWTGTKEPEPKVRVN